MVMLSPSSMSTFSIPLEFVDDPAVLVPTFERELLSGAHLLVRKIGDTFIVLHPAPREKNKTVHFGNATGTWSLLFLGGHDGPGDVCLPFYYFGVQGT